LFGKIEFEWDLEKRRARVEIAWSQNGMVDTYDEYKRKFGRP